jgi:hypothetical protein
MLNRRDVIAGITATPIATAADTTTDDAELAALSEQFADIVERLGESAWKDEALLSRLRDIGTAIMDTQATTMRGLVVKARIACFVQGGDIGLWNDDEQDQAGWPMFRAIVADLVMRHDPDLAWTNDLVPSPERARLARAIRESCERRAAASHAGQTSEGVENE